MTEKIVAKRCCRCKETKPLNDFQRARSRADGLQTWCRACRREVDASRMQDPSCVRRKNVAWYLGVKNDPIRLSLIKSRHKKWKAANNQRKREHARKDYRKHKDRYITYAHVRRAMRIGAPGNHTGWEWRDLCLLFGRICLRCGNAGKLTRDHVVPISQLGSNDIENIQPLCKPCNSAKGSKAIDFRLRSKVILKRLNKVGLRIYESAKDTSG